MIVFKYNKLHPSSLAGHMDTVRTFMRMLKRAKCHVRYSDGFNPHMLVYASPALPVGIDSVCEYMAVDMDMTPDVVAVLNSVAPAGIRIVKCWQVNAVNLAGMVTTATYNINMPKISAYANELSSKPYSMQYRDKRGIVDKEVSDKIHLVQKIDDDNLVIQLDCGNSTLRADRLVADIISKNQLKCDYLITKMSMEVLLQDIDGYLDNMMSR